MANHEAFWAWVDREIKARELTYRAAERLAGVTNATISRPARMRLEPTQLVCTALAQVFAMTPEAVMRKAGLLPPVPPPVADEDELVGLFRRLPPNVRSILMMMIRALRPLQSPSPPSRYVEAVRPRRESDDDDDLLSRQLIEEFRSLPPEWQRVALDEVQQTQQRMASLAHIIGLEEDQTQDGEAARTEAEEDDDQD